MTNFEYKTALCGTIYGNNYPRILINPEDRPTWWTQFVAQAPGSVRDSEDCTSVPQGKIWFVTIHGDTMELNWLDEKTKKRIYGGRQDKW
jgi:hypothetical protein